MVTCLACNYCRKLNLHAPYGKMDMIRVNHHQLHSEDIIVRIVMMPSINTEGNFECKIIIQFLSTDMLSCNENVGSMYSKNFGCIHNNILYSN